MRVFTVAKLAVSCLAVSLLTACPPKAPPDGGKPPGDCPSGETMTAAQAAQEKFVKVDKPIEGEYVVVLKDPAPGVQAQPVAPLALQLSAKYGGKSFLTYEHALRGFASKMSEDQAK